MQITVSKRTEIEIELFRIFGIGNLRPITPALLRRHSANFADRVSFGATPIASCLYATGAKIDKDVQSEISEFGLFYDNGDAQFAVGVFKRPHDQKFCVHIIAPTGSNWQNEITIFAEAIKESLSAIDVYTRYVYPQIIAGWQEVTVQNFPWIELAPQEDETTPQPRADITKLFTQDGFFVAGSVKKFKQNNQNLRAVRDYLREHNLSYQLKPLDDYDTAIEIIETHFASLKNPVGSTADDYRSIVKAAIELRDVQGVHSYIGYLGEKPVSVFIVQNGNIYANITLQPAELSNLPLCSHTVLFQELVKEGVSEINLGGSESDKLHRYKDKRFRNLEPERTTWLHFANSV